MGISQAKPKGDKIQNLYGKTVVDNNTQSSATQPHQRPSSAGFPVERKSQENELRCSSAMGISDWNKEINKRNTRFKGSRIGTTLLEQDEYKTENNLRSTDCDQLDGGKNSNHILPAEAKQEAFFGFKGNIDSALSDSTKGTDETEKKKKKRKKSKKTESDASMNTNVTENCIPENGLENTARPKSKKKKSHLKSLKNKSKTKPTETTEPPETNGNRKTAFAVNNNLMTSFFVKGDIKVDTLGMENEKEPSNRKITSGNNNQVKDLTLTDVEDENLKASIETVDNLRIKEEKEESWSELQIKVMIQKTKSLEEAFEQKLPRLSRMDKEYKCPQEFLQSISRIEECMKHLIKENNDYIIRLSQLAGDRLTENNPSITDLNDPKRPLKLAEQYNQLYDNEWTDAMEILVKKIPKSIDKDEKCVNYLFSLLKTVYAYCKERSKQQLHGLTEQLFLMKNPSVEQVNDMLAHNPTERKKFTEIRKQTASVAVMMLQQTLKEDGGIFIKETGECIPGMDTRIVEELLRSPYFEKCIELCWQFVIQDPPMYLETCSLKGTNINKNTHKEYTHSGYVVKYVVWPALYLHEGTNSDVLSKGVVQPEEIYFY